MIELIKISHSFYAKCQLFGTLLINKTEGGILKTASK